MIGVDGFILAVFLKKSKSLFKITGQVSSLTEVFCGIVPVFFWHRQDFGSFR
jgi:hypothetical protein